MRFRSLEIDIPEVDYFARDVLIPIQGLFRTIRIPEGVSSRQGFIRFLRMVLLGDETEATPDGRYAHTPVADGVSPSAGRM